MGRSSLANSMFLLLFAMSSLFIGAAFMYIATKAPFFWGVLFLPGVLLLVVFAMTALFGVVKVLRRPNRPGA